MPADLVTLVVWRDAVTDPPGHPGAVVTDRGYAWCAHAPDRTGPWYSELAAFGSPPLGPQPSLWCNPAPPNADAPEQLLADLRTLTTECLHNGLASVRDAAGRVHDLLPKEDS